MTKYIKRLFPNLAPSLHILLGFSYDIRKFLKTASNFHSERNANKLLAVLSRHTHGLEKAFSLPHTRVGFGVDLAAQLVEDCRRYYTVCGFDKHVRWALDVLGAYTDFQAANGTLSEKVQGPIAELFANISEYDRNDTSIGGYNLFTKEAWLKQVAACDFEKFCRSRVSVREFAGGRVPRKLLENAVSVAIQTPSACNRQPWKVRAYSGQKKEFILRYQYGNRGFSECIDTVLLISGLSSCFSYSERHQVWVDGGLFSMTLIYALHDLGLGVCPLNTAHTLKQELALRKAIQLPIDEEPIMMLAVGQLKDNFKVAKSSRKETTPVLHFE